MLSVIVTFSTLWPRMFCKFERANTNTLIKLAHKWEKKFVYQLITTASHRAFEIHKICMFCRFFFSKSTNETVKMICVKHNVWFGFFFSLIRWLNALNKGTKMCFQFAQMLVIVIQKKNWHAFHITAKFAVFLVQTRPFNFSFATLLTYVVVRS